MNGTSCSVSPPCERSGSSSAASPPAVVQQVAIEGFAAGISAAGSTAYVAACDALVVVDTIAGKVLGKTPWQQRRLTDPAQVEVELRLPGYYPRWVMLRGTQDEDIDQKMEIDLTSRGRSGSR